MKRPLIAVALLYVLGVLLAAIPAPLVPLFAFASVLALLYLFWSQARPILLGALIILAGWINLAHRTAILSPNDLRGRISRDGEIVTIRGRLCETPYQRVREDKVKDTNVWSSMARIDANEIRFNKEDWQPAAGRIMTSTKGILPDDIFAGEMVEIDGTLEPTKGPVAEGLFDYREFLKHQEIHHQLHVPSITEWHVLSAQSQRPLADRFCAWARKTLALGLPLEDESLRLEWALTLGWKAALTDTVSEPFVRASTYHIFAVDGLRIAIISGILLGLLRAVGVPKAIGGLIVIPLIWFYAAMTGWPASAIRAIVMIMVVFLGWTLKRPSDHINSLFAAAIIILVWEPAQLFQAGFQLSFFVVLCIILIHPFFKNLGERLLKPDPLLPEGLQPGWRKLLRKPARTILELLLTSVAAWLGSIPLVAWYFHLITPMSGPANVLAVPLCGFVLICNLSSLLLGAWFPFGAELFNHAGWLFMELIRMTSSWSANWPGAYFYLPMPALFTIALYYLILLTVFTGWLFQGKWRAWKISIASTLALTWCAFAIWQLPESRVTILPLSGGHAVHVQMAGHGNDWLIDCGNESSVDMVVKPFLRAKGVNRLSNLALTHGEISYSGGAKSILELFGPKNIYTSPVKFRSPEYIKFQTAILNNPAHRKPIQLGDQLGPWTVLYPGPEDHFSKADDNAIVLRGEINGFRLLLLSDLGHEGQNALLARTNDLRADIVVAGIPDKNEPLSETLLNAIQPRAIIIADAERPAAKRASSKLRARLARRNIPVFYTRDTEAVTLTFRPNHWELRGMDGARISNTSPQQPPPDVKDKDLDVAAPPDDGE
ncbi:MAG: ComEC/Rec2-related protein [Pedosphaera sp.]|nr:ComEC/Rec2-related protein [Pedosphaera sp.]